MNQLPNQHQLNRFKPNRSSPNRFRPGRSKTWLSVKSLGLVWGLLLVVQACGFAPRGSVSGATELGAIFVDAQRDVPIASLLTEKIRSQGLQLAPNRDVANILVRLTDEDQGQRVLSVQSEGKVSEFELRHDVALLVVQAEPGTVAVYQPGLKANRVSVVREYTYDETGVLGKEDEASILKNEMRDELARNLLLRIIASVQ